MPCKLREHLGAAVAVMKLSRNYDDFVDKMDRLYTRHEDTLMLPFDYKRMMTTAKEYNLLPIGDLQATVHPTRAITHATAS